MTEAEKLALELLEPMDGFPNPTQLESKAAALLRSQAAEIERLNLTIGALEGTLSSLEDKDKEIKRLRGHIKHIGNDALRTELHQKTEQIDAMKLTINNMSGILDDQSEAIIGKDALLREVLAVMFSGSTRAQKLAVVYAIKTELGENNAD